MLQAASDDRVELFLARQDANHEAFLCSECGRASARPGICPLHARALERREDGFDAAVHQVVRYGGEVIVVESDDLAEADGVGALLRF